jgi:hypothetical protein
MTDEDAQFLAENGYCIAHGTVPNEMIRKLDVAFDIRPAGTRNPERTHHSRTRLFPGNP